GGVGLTAEILQRQPPQPPAHHPARHRPGIDPPFRVLPRPLPRHPVALRPGMAAERRPAGGRPRAAENHAARVLTPLFHAPQGTPSGTLPGTPRKGTPDHE